MTTMLRVVSLLHIKNVKVKLQWTPEPELMSDESVSVYSMYTFKDRDGGSEVALLK